MKKIVVVLIGFLLLLRSSNPKTMVKKKLSPNGRKLLISLEGVVSDDGKIRHSLDEGRYYIAYKDAKGLWTAGVGTLIDTPEEEYLKTAKLTAKQVNELLTKELKRFEDAVNEGVKVDINQNQFDSLVIFAFNVGENGFLRSVLLQNINKGLVYDGEVIYNSFMNWSSGGLLTSRRKQEYDLFYS